MWQNGWFYKIWSHVFILQHIMLSVLTVLHQVRKSYYPFVYWHSIEWYFHRSTKTLYTWAIQTCSVSHWSSRTAADLARVHLLVNLCGLFYQMAKSNTSLLWTLGNTNRNITAETVAQAFVRGWISFVLSTITTDRGAQFESSLWSELMRLLGIQWTLTGLNKVLPLVLLHLYHKI